MIFDIQAEKKCFISLIQERIKTCFLSLILTTQYDFEWILFLYFINIKSTNSSLCDRKTLREGQTLTLRRADFNTYQMYIEFVPL